MFFLGFRFFALVLVLVLLLARETLSSSVNYPSSMVMWQNLPVETVVASYLQIAVTINSTAGSQKFRARLHKNTDSPKETHTSKRYNFPLEFRKNNFVALENGNKATFDCQVELPFIGAMDRAWHRQYLLHFLPILKKHWTSSSCFSTQRSSSCFVTFICTSSRKAFCVRNKKNDEHNFGG